MNKPKCPNCQNSPQPPKASPWVRKYRVRGFEVLYCRSCLNGFTYPVPENIAKYYGKDYWSFSSGLGSIKNFIYSHFQQRRAFWLKTYVIPAKDDIIRVLDVGAGEAVFAKSLGKNFRVLSLDVPGAKINNREVLKVDFLKWQTGQKFEAITFWESLEHTRSPQIYLEKAHRLLKGQGLIFIEYPRFNSPEALMFRSSWYHLDLPRHLSHLTDRGLEKILKKAGFKVIYKQPVLASEYSAAGFFGSILNTFGISIHTLHKNPLLLLLVMVLLSPVIVLSILIEIILWRLGLSPIGLVVAKKGR